MTGVARAGIPPVSGGGEAHADTVPGVRGWSEVSVAPREGTPVTSNKPGPIVNGLPSQIPDTDPEETQEWLASLDGAIDAGGRRRARYLMLRMLERARESQVGIPSLTTTDYINTITPEQEPWFPGDEEVERRYRAWIRWNAAVMVHRAQHPDISVGGHI